MSDDITLLRRFARDRSEEALAELVRRHVGFVYQAAWRQTGGDAALAADVTQTVFIELARRAASLDGRPVLAGWLHTSTRFAAHKARRTERRRREREQAAHFMSEANGAGAEWERVRPVIDEALHELEERDREAVLLRFFEGRAFADVGRALEVSEEAARKRVERALEKMQGLLARRGVTSTAAALSGALAGQAGAAAPAGLVASVTGAAMAGGTVVGWMVAGKLAAGFAVVAGAVALYGETNTNRALEAELENLRGRTELVARLRAENRRLADADAEVRAWRGDDRELVALRDEVAELSERLRRQNAAQATEASSQRGVTITGAIGMPGQYIVPTEGGMNLMELVSRAGAPNRKADRARIRVSRPMADGKMTVFIVDFADAGAFSMQPGDMVHLQETVLAR